MIIEIKKNPKTYNKFLQKISQKTSDKEKDARARQKKNRFERLKKKKKLEKTILIDNLQNFKKRILKNQNFNETDMEIIKKKYSKHAIKENQKNRICGKKRGGRKRYPLDPL
jgi:hypothetical protein